MNVGGRTVSGVAAGAIAAGSTEAINGSQINTIIVAQNTRDLGQDALIAQNSANIAALQLVAAAGNRVRRCEQHRRCCQCNRRRRDCHR